MVREELAARIKNLDRDLSYTQGLLTRIHSTPRAEREWIYLHLPVCLFMCLTICHMRFNFANTIDVMSSRLNPLTRPPNSAGASHPGRRVYRRRGQERCRPGQLRVGLSLLQVGLTQIHCKGNQDLHLCHHQPRKLIEHPGLQMSPTCLLSLPAKTNCLSLVFLPCILFC